MAITLDSQDRKELLERFLRYVQVDTQSDENSTSFPSTEKQKDLARMLVEELKALGLSDAAMDQWGYVYATLPSNIPADHPAHGKVPTIGLIAHLDTYFGTPGGGVKPQVIENYAGGDITLPGDSNQVIRYAENPNLARCLGHTLITSDGTTLLGADDKAGIAEIMTALAWMQRHPEFLHGTVRVAFTPDEEVGRGTEHFDVPGFGARYAYTLDGSDLGEIEDETFCADSALVTVEGHDVHPGYAKDKMTNAVRVAAAIIERLPKDFLPETTEGRQPYLHPYDIRGDVSKVEVKFLVRAFSEEELHQQEATLQRIVEEVRASFPQAKVSITIKESYRNMAYAIRKEPQVLEVALEAVRRMGLEPVRKAIRGGTDGARLSFMGLLTPNIWAGGQNFHSVQEWVSLEWMAKAAECALNILALWVERAGA
ncbi:peptidase T [Thermoanaerobaculum aquaticum]|uniref:peptidase T n=1 Tax=Thermoanaerobaculum aquaticum TaxID=1312852 RepID=UPI0006A6AC51|nr:peptidase T [Thermoanaerobaculum aquaticum]BCW93293.1 MAG: peptidase T [Thermoanaerobaculum sp.]